ncbi:hypothetical protein DFH09DRAFT_1322647 [Mycena vulgaris]|nr:hypothetical protein DFH09DRAFT_1322647 [Mycena vulgaris]
MSATTLSATELPSVAEWSTVEAAQLCDIMRWDPPNASSRLSFYHNGLNIMVQSSDPRGLSHGLHLSVDGILGKDEAATVEVLEFGSASLLRRSRRCTSRFTAFPGLLSPPEWDPHCAEKYPTNQATASTFNSALVVQPPLRIEAPPNDMGASGAASTAGATYGTDYASAASQLNIATDNTSTFLRGVFQSNTDGHLTIQRPSVHFHIKAYPIASSGTFVSSSAVHTGQFFFDDETLAVVAATIPYDNNSISWDDRVTNEGMRGYNANMDINWVGNDITDGLIGSTTMSRAQHTVREFNVASCTSASMLTSPAPPSSTLVTHPTSQATASSSNSAVVGYTPLQIEALPRLLARTPSQN